MLRRNKKRFSSGVLVALLMIFWFSVGLNAGKPRKLPLNLLDLKIPQKVITLQNIRGSFKFSSQFKFNKPYHSSRGRGVGFSTVMGYKAWVAAVNDGMSSKDIGVAGFKTPACQITGADIHNVTVTAKANFLDVKGEVLFSIVVCEEGTMIEHSSYFITKPGYQEITSKPFNIKSGKKYHAESYIVAEPYYPDTGDCGTAKFQSIKFNL